ncbi:MAG: hypothetical protein C0392_02510 [Syntrophus sp. (in: bacteria)]|nr:hypothetical protein [Syntrophus sp. (in: bacteria)]
MRLPPFQYLEPENITEALSMMDTYKDTVKIIAGGTEVINHMKHRLLSPAFVMNIAKLGDLGGISVLDHEIVLGASTTLKEIANSPVIKEKCKAIAEAAFQVASPTIAAMGTIGGNILQNTRCMTYNQSEIVLTGLDSCHKRGGTICLAVKGSTRCFSVYQGDMAPALIAFDAQCILRKSGATRTIPIIDLFTGNGVQPFSIGSDEILTGIIIPKQDGTSGSAYKKLRIRGSIDFPLVSAASVIWVGADGKITSSRMVIGAAGPAPRMVEEASLAIQGQLPGEIDLEALAGMAYGLTEGADNLAMPGAYRRKMARVLLKRAVQEALEDVKRGI